MALGISEYYRSELEKGGEEIAAPTLTVQAFLDSCREEIEAVVDQLADSQPPRWESRVSAGFNAPTPNMLVLTRLQKLLAAEALYRAHLGRTAEADRALEASWALNSSLRDQPEVISQLIATALARIEVGLLRRIPVDAGVWRGHLAEHDYRAGLLLAMVVESVSSLRMLPKGSSWMDRASRADFLDRRREWLVSLRDSRVSERPLPSRVPTPKSAGAIIEAISEPTLESAVRRVDRLTVDTELTDRVLWLSQFRKATGRWPSDASALPAASRLEGATWLYLPGDDGHMEISLQQGTGLGVPGGDEATDAVFRSSNGQSPIRYIM